MSVRKLPNALTLHGRGYHGEELRDELARIRIASQEADWACALQELIHDIIDANGPLIAYTSGTTGPPKRIELSRQDLLASAELTGRTFRLDSGHKVLLCLPCSYIAGKMMVVRAMVLGLDLHVIDPRGSLLDQLPEEGSYQFTAMVPQQLMRAVEEDRARTEATFRTILLGGGPISEQAERTFSTLRTRVVQSYGSTETLTHVAMRDLNGPDRADHFTAIGGIHFGLDIRGCLVVYTPHLRVQEHRTNDLVELLDEKRFRWLGRWDNVILSGGKKVHPEQLEARSAGLIPYPHYFTGTADDRLGQAVVLVVETGDPSAEVVPAIMDALVGVLDKHELPRMIRTVPKLGSTESGKVLRR